MKINKFATKVDRLGVLAFLYVIIYSVFKLIKGFDVLTLVLLLVGIGGLCVDGFIVSRTYDK